jgi:hypothetical protein
MVLNKKVFDILSQYFFVIAPPSPFSFKAMKIFGFVDCFRCHLQTGEIFRKIGFVAVVKVTSMSTQRLHLSVESWLPQPNSRSLLSLNNKTRPLNHLVLMLREFFLLGWQSLASFLASITFASNTQFEGQVMEYSRGKYH